MGLGAIRALALPMDTEQVMKNVGRRDVKMSIIPMLAVAVEVYMSVCDEWLAL